MPTCDSCGNEYDKTFVVEKDGERYTFDAFECAVHHLAPACGHCGARIMGHGVEARGDIFCCAHCARAKGQEGTADRV